MKRLWSVVSILVMIGMIVGCSDSSDQSKDGAEVSLKEMYEEIKDKVAEDSGGNLDAYMDIDLMVDESESPAEMYKEMLELNMDEVASGYVLAPQMNLSAHEMILLEAAEEGHVDALKETLEKRKEAQMSVWETYLPDEYEKVKNTIIKSNGNYLIYITYDEPEAIEAIFDSYFE